MKVHDFDEIGFAISQPDGWLHTPPTWARHGQETLLREEKGFLAEAIRNSPAPFIHLHKLHGSLEHAYPTVQARARPNGMARFDYSAVLATLLAQLAKSMPEAEILDSSDRFLLSGHRALSYESAYALETEIEGRKSWLECTNRVLIIPVTAWIFTVGFTAPADPDYACEEGMEAILKSIKIR